MRSQAREGRGQRCGFGQRLCLVVATVLAVSCAGASSDSASNAAPEASGEAPTPVPSSRTPADTGASEGQPEGPRWYADVAPLVARRCGSCHRPDGIAPFSLLSYETAAPFAAAMADAVNSGRMPPWLAEQTADCQPRFGWKHDLRLAPAEKAIISQWAESGAPKGQPTGVEVPLPDEVHLVDPTARIDMPKAFEVAGNTDVFRCFPLPHVFEQDTWVTGLEVVPGDAAVVHHVLVWVDEKGASDALMEADGSYPCFGAPGFSSRLLGAWAPGGGPVTLPPSSGIPLPKGSKIVINVHYHPLPGSARSDRTAIDLRWVTTRPGFEAALALVGNAETEADGLLPGANDPPQGPAFLIPADARGHVEQMRFQIQGRIPIPIRIFAVGTHMHYVGTGMRMQIDRRGRVGGAPRAEPEQECLIETPRWDFHWQRGYDYDVPLSQAPTLMDGDTIALRCLYDNSRDNPYVAEALREQGLRAPRDVLLGEQTLDEMCLGVVGVAYPAIGSALRP